MSGNPVALARKSVRQLARRFGYTIVPNRVLPNEWAHFKQLLAATHAPCIFDVGANEGNTVDRALATFPAARVYAFEPLPDMIQRLQERFASEPRVTVVGSAAGDRSGQTTFHVNPASVQSSKVFW